MKRSRDGSKALLKDSVARRVKPGTIIVVAIAWSVVGAELTLYWNRVTGIYTMNSTGQPIPFVIGLYGYSKL